MNNIPFRDRAAFWKYQSASVAFEMVRDTCIYLRQHSLSTSHSIHDSLVTSIYVLYARPFKQSNELKLEEDLVASEYRATHAILLQLRNTMFVHTDLHRPVTVDGYRINELAGYTRNGSTKFGVSVVTPVLPSVEALAASLVGETSSRADSIWRQYMSHERVPDGTSIVNLEPNDGPFLVPHPML
jgi:hypothetical protein